MPYVVEMGGALGAKRGPDGVHMLFGPLWWGRTFCVRSVESYLILPPPPRMDGAVGTSFVNRWVVFAPPRAVTRAHG